jgi:ketosteroid isomerase-like protein
MTRDELERWIAAYERAWRTPGTGALGELFAPDATYVTQPFAEPLRGLDALGPFWENERRGPEEAFALASEILAVDGDTGVARIEIRYDPPEGQVYRDLWVVTLGPDGRCTAFEEWPFWPEHGSNPAEHRLEGPRVLVEGDTPVTRALLRLAADIELDTGLVGDDEGPRPGDLALVAASHTPGEIDALRAALEAGVPYVGLVGSRRRTPKVLDALRDQGVPEELVARIDTPAGLDLGAEGPPEIALAVLAQIVAVRRAAA